MDKYEGVNRPETVYTETRYQTIERKDFDESKPQRKPDNKAQKIKAKTESPDAASSEISKTPSSKNKYKRIFTVVRYAACLLLLAVCLIGRFTQFKPAIQAGNYIKTQLERDITQEISANIG